MHAITIHALISASELERAYQVLRELRVELSPAEFASTYAHAQAADGYCLVGAYVGDQLAAIMGYRVLHDFVHGKHLYVDDLVTTAALRSRGIGAKLLHYAEDEARRLGCRGLRLCTGVANEAGKRFYEREGWNARAVAYKKPLS